MQRNDMVRIERMACGMEFKEALLLEIHNITKFETTEYVRSKSQPRQLVGFAIL